MRSRKVHTESSEQEHPQIEIPDETWSVRHSNEVGRGTDDSRPGMILVESPVNFGRDTTVMGVVENQQSPTSLPSDSRLSL